MSTSLSSSTQHKYVPGVSRLTGQKPPLKPKEVWSIRVRLQLSENLRELALFNLAIDSKLRSCDLVALRVGDVTQGGRVKGRAIVIQQKTHSPVQFELTEQTREAVQQWIRAKGLRDPDCLFPSRIHDHPHLSTRQYARMVVIATIRYFDPSRTFASRKETSRPASRSDKPSTTARMKARSSCASS